MILILTKCTFVPLAWRLLRHLFLPLSIFCLAATTPAPVGQTHAFPLPQILVHAMQYYLGCKASEARRPRAPEGPEGGGAEVLYITSNTILYQFEAVNRPPRLQSSLKLQEGRKDIRFSD